MSDIRAEVERWMRANASKATSGLTVAGNFAAKVKEVSFRAPDLVWTAVTFQNSWADYDATNFNATGYRIDDDGRTHIRGIVKSGTLATAAFTVPVGYRAAKRVTFPAVANDAFARLDVQTDGTVNPWTGSNVYFSLEGYSWLAATPAAAPGWTSGGFPMTIDPQLGQPAAGVICWSCLDIGADYAATAGSASGAPLPRVVWRGQADGRVSIQRFAGLAPGRQYRAQLVFFAG